MGFRWVKNVAGQPGRWYVAGPPGLIPEGHVAIVSTSRWAPSGLRPRHDSEMIDRPVLITKHVAQHTVRHQDGTETHYVLAEFYKKPKADAS